MSSERKLSKNTSDECLSSSMLDISVEEDSNSQTRPANSVTTDDEVRTYRRRKPMKYKNQKSHRLIEKRRRDRMNRSLHVLLDLIPHKRPENQRRIEKTEIIEMAVKYLRHLKSSSQKSFDPIDLNRRSRSKIDVYSSGYHNGIYDTYTYVEKHFNDETLVSNLIDYIKEKEDELKDLLAIPRRKGKIALNKESQCAISNAQKHDDLLQFSIDEQQNSLPSNKVPIFVLHPSGTYYLPMSIDISIVSHAFHTKSQLSSMNEQPPCHPVSIPVNFNPVSCLSDSYELDIQNINIISTRHQTSIRPN